MDNPEHAIAIFEKHLSDAGLPHLHGLTTLELGPGDSVATALIAHAYGARRTYLVDVGRFARTDMWLYHEVHKCLRRRGLNPVNIDGITSVEGLLDTCAAEYLTRGLDSLRAIPTGSIDYLWSNAVLEHVRLDEFQATLNELRRVISDGGIASHRIDLQDHLAESLNHLRFDRARSQSPLFSRSGFYTNPLRPSEILHAFKAARFVPMVIASEQWPSLPAPASGFGS